MKFHQVRVPPCKCPTCGLEWDGATEVNNNAATPTPGDFSLCINCGELMRYSAELELVRAGDLGELLAGGVLTADQVEGIRMQQRFIRLSRQTIETFFPPRGGAA